MVQGWTDLRLEHHFFVYLRVDQSIRIYVQPGTAAIFYQNGWKDTTGGTFVKRIRQVALRRRDFSS